VSDSRLVIVDGYNLVLRNPALRPGPDRTLRESRDKLVNLLSWVVGAGDARFMVVFDGAESGGGATGGGRVEVRYSKPPSKADDLIRALVVERTDRDEELTVVTSDIEVARHARALGADIILADLFVASLIGPQAEGDPEKPPTLSKKEIEEWAEIFRRGKPTKGEEPGGS